MGTLIGAVAAIVSGLVLAAGGTAVLTSTANPDAAPQVQQQIQKQFDPLMNPDVIYGH